MQISNHLFNSYNKIFSILFLIIVLCGASANVFAQFEDNDVIIEGNPSLTKNELEKSVKVLEKILGASVESPTVRYYASHDAEKGKSGVIASLKDFAAMESKIQNLSDEKIKQLREAVVEKLREANDSEVYAYLVETYDGAQSKTNSLTATSDNSVNEISRTETRNVQVLKNGGTIRDLVGKWEKKSSGMSSYTGGVYQGSSGNYESYEFSADGRVAYTTLIAVQNYGCRLEAFAQSKGRVSVSGTNMTMNLSAGTIRRDDSCSPSKNYTKATNATNDDYQWRIEKDEYGNVQLALTGSDGNTFLYRKAQ